MMRKTIGIIGLGYVGLPLAIALAKEFVVIGFDINENRIDELSKGYDRTNEVPSDVLRATTLQLSLDSTCLERCQLYIVTVPTPVDEFNQPDLKPLQSACHTIAPTLRKGDTVVFESTVYPGVTQEYCGELLQDLTGLMCGVDFFLGYSPERINPGDSKHTIQTITKVVAGQNKVVEQELALIYGAINNGNIFIAADIKTAEAAKVIENAQRDINIAFINEISIIFNKMGISIYDVLEAAKTKWNFLPFTPGLVGGHCIGVDPYYLAQAARSVGHDPEVILVGRRINEGLANIFGRLILDFVKKKSIPIKRILVLGLTFKENIPDLRNTKVIDLMTCLSQGGRVQVDVHDPYADINEAKQHYGIHLLTSLDDVKEPYDMVVGAVAHRAYTNIHDSFWHRLVTPKGVVADLKNLWGPGQVASRHYWAL